MMKWRLLLLGNDLRSIGQSNDVVQLLKSQDDFDSLFKLIFDADRIVAMRAADALEKCSVINPSYLTKHKAEILRLSSDCSHIELKWHLALFISRIHFLDSEIESVSAILFGWLCNKSESKIVRVNALQAIVELVKDFPNVKKKLEMVLPEIIDENIPSLKARIKKLKLQ